MRKKLLAIIVFLLLSFSFFGTISSAYKEDKLIYKRPIYNEYSHTILGEFFTNTSIIPCKYSHLALKELYDEGWHPFYYITYLCDKNNNSKQRKTELNVLELPEIVWDGGYKKNSLVGNFTTEYWKTKFNESIFACGARDVTDMDLSIEIDWQGAVNPCPEDGATDVPVEIILSCSISEMEIDVEAKNNEVSDYNGHIHVQVTEAESEWWNDKFGDPFTFEFKDYAFNDDVQIGAGETWNETIIWDGCDYNDGDDPPRYFDHIKQDNIMIIATAMNNNLNKWVDEAIGSLAGINTDPKKFDFYFGDTNPPPKIISNMSMLKYDPPGKYINWTITYYWKVDVWNNLGELNEGDVWSFTTRGNSPPNPPIPIYPPDGAENVSICFYLEWNCSDPDGDDLTYDFYFGDSSPPPLVANNITEETFDFTPFANFIKFNTTYYWKIVAWDPYGLNSTGGIWSFRTEPNYPPNKAKYPIPRDGALCVPPDAILYWNGSDPNQCDILTYDVYFGLNPDPPLVSYNQTENYYDPYGPDDMPLFEDFYWRIDTRDRAGLETRGDNWSFITGINPPPTNPKIDGPHKGKKDNIYDFTFVSWDPIEQKIMYAIKWGDNCTNETDFYNSNQTVTLSHSWADTGNYIIEARAMDEYGEYSNWSTHEINIPRNRAFSNYHNIMSWLLERFPILERLLNLIFKLM